MPRYGRSLQHVVSTIWPIVVVGLNDTEPHVLDVRCYTEDAANDVAQRLWGTGQYRTVAVNDPVQITELAQ